MIFWQEMYCALLTDLKALDETALFGCGCRHEFPLMFVNLKHGERSFFQFVFILLLLIYNFVLVLAE